MELQRGQLGAIYLATTYFLVGRPVVNKVLAMMKWGSALGLCIDNEDLAIESATDNLASKLYNLPYQQCRRAEQQLTMLRDIASTYHIYFCITAMCIVRDFPS